ncbi:MAG TPA: type I-E CRISPR-associated protein Cas6/Cse3/CasE [Anaerohalosphaeraceae bacterium]|nr:type I-E CRISPR-associated protein Cas6/Cse3/CasE [Anaerohalosphaeraceae bacterium]
MYLSCLLINVGDNPDRPRPGRLWLRNRYHVHQRLCMAFPSASRKIDDVHFLKPFKPDEFGNGQIHVARTVDSGFLFRIDPLPSGRAAIIVQSALKPDWDYAFHNAMYLLAGPPEVKRFEPHFRPNQWLRFRLAANPTRRLSKHSPDAKKESVGKRVPVPTEKLIDWLARRAESAGFLIKQETVTLQLGYIYMNKHDKGQRLRSVLFDGLLQVTDPDAFRQTLIRGIGSGKAFGFGLLSVAPVQTADAGEAT